MTRLQRVKWTPKSISLRSKLILANIVTATLAMLIIGIVIVSRTSSANEFFTRKLSESERQLAEDNLSNSAEGYAHDLDVFFINIRNSMRILGLNTEVLLSEQSTLGTGKNWDARERLTQLPSGSWDNSDTEAGSIFLPAGKTPETNFSEINTLKQLDLLAPGMLESNTDLVAVYFGSALGETLYYPNVDLAHILPADFDITQRPWYIAASPAQNLDREIVWSRPYIDAALNGLVITASTPITDKRNVFRGVAAMDIRLEKITSLISQIRVGDTGYAFLIDKDGHIIAMSERGYKDFGVTAEDIENGIYLDKSLLTDSPMSLFSVLAKMTSSQSGITTTPMGDVEKYIAYHPIPTVGYSLGVVVDVSETQQNVMETEQQLTLDARRTILNLAGIMAAVWVIFLLVSRALGNTLTQPLAELTAATRLVARGDLSAEITISSRSEDEVGLLATTLATMTKNLRATIDATEQRVVERTADLEKAKLESEKRAEELKTISEVGRAIATEVNLEELLNLITYMVSERFGFYHVGVFLNDTVTRFAVLRAANSPGGKRMLERGHKLHIGQEGIVGYVTGTGEARIALDVGDDAVYFNNPDMPNTRSEMALPLKLRGRVIGALDVQSTEPNAFTNEDVETLGILADQIAIAIENARLLAETQQALAEVQALYGEYVGRTWERKTSKAPIGYIHTANGGKVLTSPPEWEEATDAIATGRTLISARQEENTRNTISAMAVPIRLYNQTIGVIDIRSVDPTRQWKTEEIAAVEAIADRLGLALENARLFEETSARASREHAVAEISAKIRSTNDPQAMIRTAIEELQRVLGATRVEIVPQTVTTPPRLTE